MYTYTEGARHDAIRLLMQVKDTITSCDPRLKIAPHGNCTRERRQSFERLWW